MPFPATAPATAGQQAGVPPREARAGPRLADRHARRREGARGRLRAVSRRRTLHAAARAAGRSSPVIERRRDPHVVHPAPAAAPPATIALPAAVPRPRSSSSLRPVRPGPQPSHCVAQVGRHAGAGAASLLLLHADAVRVGPVRRLLRARTGSERSAAPLMRPIMAAHGQVGPRRPRTVLTAMSLSLIMLRAGSRRYYNREASVVYPPVDTDVLPPGRHRPRALRAHRVGAGALQTDRPCHRGLPTWRDVPLKIVGDGPERPALERAANGRAEFLGRRPDDDVRDALPSRRAWCSCPARKTSASSRSRRRRADARSSRWTAAARSKRSFPATRASSWTTRRWTRSRTASPRRSPRRSTRQRSARTPNGSAASASATKSRRSSTRADRGGRSMIRAQPAARRVSRPLRRAARARGVHPRLRPPVPHRPDSDHARASRRCGSTSTCCRSSRVVVPLGVPPPGSLPAAPRPFARGRLLRGLRRQHPGRRFGIVAHVVRADLLRDRRRARTSAPSRSRSSSGPSSWC